MSLREEQEKFSRDVATLLIWCFDNGYTVTFGEAQRTTEQQAIYMKTGRSTTMNSKHLSRLAIDLNVFREGVLLCTVESMQPIGNFWCALDSENVWGGNWKTFKDTPHFQRGK